MYAGKHGYAESMKFLTDNLSSNLNEEDKLHNTILMLTVAQDKFHLANKLIKSGAEVNYVNSKGYTALHYCVMRKQKEASSFLLQKGANQHIVSTAQLNKENKLIPGKDCCDIAKENGLAGKIEKFYDCNHLKKVQGKPNQSFPVVQTTSPFE